MSPSLGLVSSDGLNTDPPQSLYLCWMRGTHDPVPGRGVAGVYVIWRTGAFGRECLVVGEARDISTDLMRMVRESHIAAYAASGSLEISWAAAASVHRTGIAGFLSETLEPLLNGSGGAARQIPVNLPS